MEAGMLFAQTEGFVPAPETNHAIKATIDIATKCREKNEEKVILFNFSGHGLLDLKAYEDYMNGTLVDFEADPAAIRTSLASTPIVH